MNDNQQNQSTLDPQAVDLAKSIRQVESGGNYQAQGKSGEYGGYQFLPSTWDAIAPQYGINTSLQNATPAQQNEVAYKRIKDWKDQGYNIGQIASMWNAGGGEPNAYQGTFANGQTSVGVNQYGASYNVPAYAQKVAETYHSMRNSAAATGGLGGFNPQAYQENAQTGLPSETAQQIQSGNWYSSIPQNEAENTTQNNSQKTGILQNLQKGNILSVNGKEGIGGAIGNILDFGLPVVNDVWKDIASGKINGSGKTPLQQLGDLGLSALWFVPGLGEAADAAKAGETAVEGAGKTVGVLGNLFSNNIVKNAALGYGAGVASNLSQGKGMEQSVMPNVNTVAGSVFGGLGGIVEHYLSGIGEKIAGIDTQMSNALRDGSISPDLYNQYINAAKSRATNIRSETPLTLAADALEGTATAIKNQVSVAGKVVGDAKNALSNLRVPKNDINDIANAFKNEVANRFGLNIFSNKEPSTLIGRVSSLSSGDANRLSNIYQEISQHDQNTTARTISDIITKIDDNIKYTKAANNGFDPLNSVLYGVRSDLNSILEKISPDFANANKTFSELKQLQQEIKTMAGAHNERGTLLMRRVFSGDKSGAVQDFFNKIKNFTGVDLINHAVLAKFAIDHFGNSSEKTLLSQALEGAVAAHTGGILPFAKRIAQGAAQKVYNPERIGRELVKNNPGVLGQLFAQTAQRAAMRGGISAADLYQPQNSNQ